MFKLPAHCKCRDKRQRKIHLVCRKFGRLITLGSFKQSRKKIRMNIKILTVPVQ
jgi:hypothetical protein